MVSFSPFPFHCHIQLIMIRSSAADKVTDSSCSINLPEQAYVYCVPERDYTQPTPPKGFLFFQIENLLPPALMDVVAGFSQYDPYGLPQTMHLRRVGLAAVSCQPASPFGSTA